MRTRISQYSVEHPRQSYITASTRNPTSRVARPPRILTAISAQSNALSLLVTIDTSLGHQRIGTKLITVKPRIVNTIITMMNIPMVSRAIGVVLRSTIAGMATGSIP